MHALPPSPARRGVRPPARHAAPSARSGRASSQRPPVASGRGGTRPARPTRPVLDRTDRPPRPGHHRRPITNVPPSGHPPAPAPAARAQGPHADRARGRRRGARLPRAERRALDAGGGERIAGHAPRHRSGQPGRRPARAAAGGGGAARRHGVARVLRWRRRAARRPDLRRRPGPVHPLHPQGPARAPRPGHVLPRRQGGRGMARPRRRSPQGGRPGRRRATTPSTTRPCRGSRPTTSTIRSATRSR